MCGDATWVIRNNTAMNVRSISNMSVCLPLRLFPAATKIRLVLVADFPVHDA